MRNLTNKMLEYALGRGLNRRDACVVNDIVAQVERNNYSAQTLIQSIVLSMPFRYQSPGLPTPGVTSQISSKAAKN